MACLLECEKINFIRMNNVKYNILVGLVLLLYGCGSYAEVFTIKGDIETKVVGEDNRLSFYQNDLLVVSGSDFAIDGYSVLNVVSGVKNGFIVNLRGSNFGAYFDVYINKTNKEYFVTKAISDYSYNKDENTSIKITCEKNINLKYKNITVDSLGVLLYSTDDKEFDKYCYSTEWKSD